MRSRQLNDVKNNSQAGNFLIDIIPVMSYIENVESDKRSSLFFDIVRKNSKVVTGCG